MSFAAQLAADMAYIIDRADAEFAVVVSYWDRDADTTGAADATVNGIRFEQAADRRDDQDGQSARREISVMVTQAELAAVDVKGFVGVDGVVYSIRQVSGADGVTWRIKGCVDEIEEYGAGSRMYGG